MGMGMGISIGMGVGVGMGNHKFKNAMTGSLRKSCVSDLVILNIH